MVSATGSAAGGETESYAKGGGFEYAITNHVTLKTECLYVDLGSQQLADLGDFAGVDIDIHFHTVKASFNLLLN